MVQSTKYVFSRGQLLRLKQENDPVGRKNLTRQLLMELPLERSAH